MNAAILAVHELIEKLRAQGASSEELGDLVDAQQMLVQRATARQQEAERAARYDELVPLCRDAKELVATKVRELASADQEYSVACQRRVGSEGRLSDILAAKPKSVSYPSAREIAAWQSRLSKAEKDLSECQATCRAANESRDRISGELRRAREAFAALDLQARMNAPHEAPPTVLPVAWRLKEGPEVRPV